MKVKRSSSTHVKQQQQSTPKKSSVKGCSGSSKKSGQKQGKIKFEPSTPIFYNQNSNSCSNDTTLSSAASSSNTLVADTPSQAQAQVQTKEAKVRSLLKELQVHVRHIHQERAKNEPNLTTIVKTHERVKKEDKITKFFRNKLRSMYTAAMKESENEIKCLREALDCINQIRHTQNEIRILQQQLQQQQLLHQTSPSSSALLHPCAADAALNHHMYLGSLAQSYHDEALSKTGAATNSTMRRGVLMSILQQAALTLPLWVGEIGQPAPPLCGSMPPEPFYMCKIGDKVAALIKNNTNNTTITASTTTTKSKNKKSKNAAVLDTTLNGTVGGAANEEPGEEEENWILAEVVGFNQHQGRYEVDDVDAPEGQERHSLGKRRVVPLPLWRANPLTDPQAIFPKDSFVLALYPQTTCFYRGIVYEAPQTPQDDYQVLFEDNTYPEGYSPPLLVPQLYVVADRCNKNK